MADPDFQPLFVGITWPSQWAGFLPLSYPAKAEDADETGLIWANYLLESVEIGDLFWKSISTLKTPNSEEIEVAVLQ